MNSKDFYESLTQQYNNELPFVAFRKPNVNTIKAILQNDSEFYKVSDFSERGFVFAPFDDKEDAVLIPSEKSKILIVSEVILNVPIAIGSEESHIKFSEDEIDKKGHINLIQKGIEAIHDNQFKKVVLSRKENVSISETNPISIFKSLLNEYISAFVYIWFHPKVGLWLGATPETLLKVEGSYFSTMALAGTQQYKGTVDVQWEDKEKIEQQLVNNYIVENLKELVTDLSVSEVKTIKAGSLLHLKSDISGSINNQTNYLQLLIKALHPTPAVCGLPRDKAKEFILNNENYDREFYTGFLGEIGDIDSALFVNLRCMQLKNNKAILYVGGGITKDSISENELEETHNKAEIIKRVL